MRIDSFLTLALAVLCAVSSAHAATPENFRADVTLANGVQFQHRGTRADGTVDWLRADGEVFEGVSAEVAVSFGLSAGDAQRYYNYKAPEAAAAPTAASAPAEPAAKAPTSPYSTDMTLANGTQFQFKGRNADGTVNWLAKDGQVFNGVSQSQAAGYGMSAADAQKYYTPPPSGAPNQTQTTLKAGETVSAPNAAGISWVQDAKGTYLYMVAKDPASAPKMIGGLEQTVYKAPDTSAKASAFPADMTLPNGVKFQYKGRNADGTANWYASDGQTFNNVTVGQAVGYGMTTADVKRFYPSLEAASGPFVIGPTTVGPTAVKSTAVTATAVKAPASAGPFVIGGSVSAPTPAANAAAPAPAPAQTQAKPAAETSAARNFKADATLSNGGKLQFYGYNFDGTVNWIRSDGQFLKRVTVAEAQKLGLTDADVKKFYKIASVPASAAVVPTSAKVVPAKAAAPGAAAPFVVGPSNGTPAAPATEPNKTRAVLKPGETVTAPNADGISWVKDAKGVFMYMVSDNPAAVPKMPGGLEKNVYLSPAQTPAAATAPFTADMVLPNGVKFQFKGRNADGTVNWYAADGQTFNNVTLAQATGYGMTAADAKKFYSPAASPFVVGPSGGPVPFKADMILPNGVQFQLISRNADGSVNWLAADGQVFNNVSQTVAASYGMTAADAKKFYGQ
jgi:hypothetical protein